MPETYVSERQLVARYKEIDAANPLDNLSLDEIDAYIDANVTDLASARAVLKKVGRSLKRHEAMLDLIADYLKLQKV